VAWRHRRRPLAPPVPPARHGKVRAPRHPAVARVVAALAPARPLWWATTTALNCYPRHCARSYPVSAVTKDLLHVTARGVPGAVPTHARAGTGHCAEFGALLAAVGAPRAHVGRPRWSPVPRRARSLLSLGQGMAPPSRARGDALALCAPLVSLAALCSSDLCGVRRATMAHVMRAAMLFGVSTFGGFFFRIPKMCK